MRWKIKVKIVIRIDLYLPRLKLLKGWKILKMVALLF